MTSIRELASLGRFVAITDDRAAREIAVLIGALEELIDPPPSSPWLRLATHEHQEGAFVVCGNISGLDAAGENGFFAHVFPYSIFSKQEVEAHTRSLLHMVFGDDADTAVSWVKSQPDPKQT